MSAPRHAFVTAAGHEMHVTEWGDPAARPLVMWHGLARTGRDFDEIAQALSDRYFVLCPDTIGRGLSQWSDAPDVEYSVTHYARTALALLDAYGIAQADWIGTSMGGLIGMWLAAGPDAARLGRMVINDIGPELPADAVQRILTYTSDLPDFATLAEAEHWLRQVYAPFGPAREAFWSRMARTSVRRRANGRLTLHFDPRITVQFTASPQELVTWDRWDRIALPVLVTQGATSDILPDEVLDRMRGTGPRPQVQVFDDCGHAPTLSRPDDIAMVRRFLSAAS
ncbi:alpha/beta fold hydrolase [Pseudooceanicola aestuarii]|uniref:alpha/beta fold hydrolase n=1 Tax=Pseudooceanicola aestuarii TaxID=2697319 RepID=UPI0013D0D2F7|nr:alpha/beta hydrolase [Pseudooceanicola aestuarii]